MQLSVKFSLSYLKQRLADGTWSVGERLATLKQLAKYAGVSAGAMKEALADLQNKGKISIFKNRGIYAGNNSDIQGQASGTPQVKESIRKWEQVRVQLEQSIYEGAFSGYPKLPSVKELMTQYNVCFATMKKVLDALEENRVIARSGASLVIAEQNYTSQHDSLLYVIAMSKGDAKTWMKTELGRRSIYYFQRECLKAKVNLVLSIYNLRSKNITYIDVDKEKISNSNFLGYIVFAIHLSESATDSLIHNLGQVDKKSGRVPGDIKRPVAIIDGKGGGVALSPEQESKAVRVFQVARNQSGQEVGRYLLGKGHKKIAFVSSCHREPWSQSRLAGLKESFKKVEKTSAITPYVLDHYDEPEELPELNAKAKGMLKKLSSIYKALEQLSGTLFDISAGDNIKNSFREFEYNLKRSLCLAPLLGNLVKEISTKNGITACVGANDTIALYVRFFLSRAGLQIPRDVALLGFDDMKSASDHDLTSYKFNVSNIANKCLSFILYPSFFMQQNRQSIVECRGTLVERKSTQS